MSTAATRLQWHLGQRPMFLPGARGFDTYLGIPYSDDMGQARRSPCPHSEQCGGESILPASEYVYTPEDGVHGSLENLKDLNTHHTNGVPDLTPLVFQSGGVSSTPGCELGLLVAACSAS